MKPDVEPTPDPRFDLWLPALESGLLHLTDLVSWADQEVMRLSAPPAWLLNLSLSTSIDGVYLASSDVPDWLDTTGWQPFYPTLLVPGMLYLRFQNGEINLHDLLLAAGQHADCAMSNDLPACEAFFYLLNEAEGYQPPNPNGRPILGRVHELFAPMVAHTVAALPHLRRLTAAGE